MAKKKKRADYQAPARVQEPTRAEKAAASAARAVDEGADDAKDAAFNTNERTSSAKARTGAAKGQTPKGAKAGAKGRQSGGQSAGMSAQAQWGVVIAAIALIVGGVLAYSFITAGGGDGVLSTTTWDIPARDSDTDNGDSDGRIKLTDFTGTPTVVNFFASWCVDCDRELPHYTRAGDNYKDQFDLVFVNANEDSGDWRDMMDRHDIVGNYPIGKDIKGTNRNGLMRALGGGEGMPATAFYDASGRLVKFSRGLVEERTFLNELAALGVEL